MIGLDIDSKNRCRLLKAYLNSASIARVEVYSTAHGFHLKIRKHAGIAKQMQTRLYLGDCKGRLWIDELKIAAGLFELVDTLFEFKKTMQNRGRWNREELIEDMLAPPFWEPHIALKRARWKKWEKKQASLSRKNIQKHSKALGL
jgi:hypothetical protein